MFGEKQKHRRNKAVNESFFDYLYMNKWQFLWFQCYSLPISNNTISSHFFALAVILKKIYTILIFFKNGKRKSLGLKCSVLSQGQKLLGVICIKYGKRITRRKNDKREQILYPCFCQRKVWKKRMTWLARFVFQLALSGCIKTWTPRIKTKVEHILV